MKLDFTVVTVVATSTTVTEIESVVVQQVAI